MNRLYKRSRVLGGAILAALTVLTSFTAQAALDGFEVSAELFAVRGTSTTIPVGSEGNATNVSRTWDPSAYIGSPTVAVFELKETFSGETVYLRIDVTGVGGALANANTVEGLGVFQTTNSQGLTDPGSFSIYVSPMNASSVVVGGAWTIDLQFSFFSTYTAGENGALGTFANERTTQLILTTLDLDHGQQYFVSHASFSENHKGNEVSYTSNPPAGYTGFTLISGATVDERNHAVSSVMNTGLDSFDIRLGNGGGQALYMFELRNPPENANPMPDPVPEPGLVALAGAGGAAMLVQRLRRRCA